MSMLIRNLRASLLMSIAFLVLASCFANPQHVSAQDDAGYVDTGSADAGYVDSGSSYVDTSGTNAGWGDYGNSYVDTSGSNAGYANTGSSYVDTSGTNAGWGDYGNSYVDTSGSNAGYANTGSSYVDTSGTNAGWGDYGNSYVDTSGSNAGYANTGSSYVDTSGSNAGYVNTGSSYVDTSGSNYGITAPVEITAPSSIGGYTASGGYSSGGYSSGSGYSTGGYSYSQPTYYQASYSSPSYSYSYPSSSYTYQQQQVITHPTPSCTISQTSAGDVNQISWSSQNAASATLSGLGSVPTSGSQTVYGSGSYVLTVNNGYGQTATCQVAITITHPAPSCQISAVQTGPNTAQLTWSSQYANSAMLSNVGNVPVNGSQAVSGTGAYTLTVSDAYGQTANCQTSVVIQHPAPSCSIYQSQTGTNAAQITWNSQNAVSAMLSNVGNVPPNGTQMVYNSGSYILTVTDNYGQTATCQTATNIYVPPTPAPSCTLSLTGSYDTDNGNSYNNNQPATLTWSSNNANSASISSLGSVAPYGSQTVYPYNGQAYTMTVTGAGGTATCQSQAAYIPTPTPAPTPVQNLACQISASQTTITNGQSTYLAWASNGQWATLSDGIGNVAANGTLSVTPESSRTYVLTVHGYDGQVATCNVDINVRGGTPFVSLTQIPYTGFDFGTFGNMVYWLALLAFALSAAYLVVYYQGGLAFLKPATTRVPATATPRVAYAPAADTKRVPVPAPMFAETVMDMPPVKATQSAPTIELPTAQGSKMTLDSMQLIESKNGEAPRIIIKRE